MELNFPIKGIFKGGVTGKQPIDTSPDMNNMRPYDTLENRARGGQRPALDKWGDGDQIGGTENPVVFICSVSTVA